MQGFRKELIVGFYLCLFLGALLPHRATADDLHYLNFVGLSYGSDSPEIDALNVGIVNKDYGFGAGLGLVNYYTGSIPHFDLNLKEFLPISLYWVPYSWNSSLSPGVDHPLGVLYLSASGSVLSQYSTDNISGFSDFDQFFELAVGCQLGECLNVKAGARFLNFPGDVLAAHPDRQNYQWGFINAGLSWGSWSGEGASQKLQPPAPVQNQNAPVQNETAAALGLSGAGIALPAGEENLHPGGTGEIFVTVQNNSAEWEKNIQIKFSTGEHPSLMAAKPIRGIPIISPHGQTAVTFAVRVPSEAPLGNSMEVLTATDDLHRTATLPLSVAIEAQKVKVFKTPKKKVEASLLDKKFEDLMASGRKAMKLNTAEGYLQSRDIFEKALQLKPHNSDARELLQKAEEGYKGLSENER